MSLSEAERHSERPTGVKNPMVCKMRFFVASQNDNCLQWSLNLTFAIRVEKQLFLGMNRLATLDIKGVNFQNGL